MEGNFDPTPKNRVNKSISNNITLTYKFHTLLETSGHGQGLLIHQHIELILGGKGNKFLKNCLKNFPKLHSEGVIVQKLLCPKKIQLLLSSHETPPLHILIY